MGRWRCTGVVVLIILLLSVASHGRELPIKKSDQIFVYNHTLAKTIVEYASVGFEMRSLIVGVENCLQAFVGVAHNLNSIVVAIRGTQENRCSNKLFNEAWKCMHLNCL
ncbi:hypothetical protein SETIT_4G085300v2 [Setaria italica]|uniref:Uncharacterized protein n=1 Tax=Setaria italica TaxID=4555 RepID=A0A368QU33_SETIT|nr:hypothetical protein SETIT_4G085300v2 [Setaria italica]